MISIKDLDKAAVLAALYNVARPQGMDFMRFDPKPMTVEEARGVLERQQHFDYLQGRVMKIDLSGDEFDPQWYDRDNGQEGAALQAIEAMGITGDVNDIAIRAQHASGIRAAAEMVLDNLDLPTSQTSSSPEWTKPDDRRDHHWSNPRQLSAVKTARRSTVR